LITQKDYTLEELEPKVVEHEQHFSKNLNTEEIRAVNRLLENQSVQLNYEYFPRKNGIIQRNLMQQNNN
jgi:hypothetical protein